MVDPTLFSIVSKSNGSSAAKIIASTSLSTLDFFLGKLIERLNGYFAMSQKNCVKFLKMNYIRQIKFLKFLIKNKEF